MTDVSIEVNNKEIPLNELMKEMLSNLILGYLKSAKDIPDPIKTISIEINY